jgi:hypothetical protein
LREKAATAGQLGGGYTHPGIRQIRASYEFDIQFLFQDRRDA